MPCAAQGVRVQGPDAGDQRARGKSNDWNRLLHYTRESDLLRHTGSSKILGFFSLSLSIEWYWNLTCCIPSLFSSPMWSLLRVVMSLWDGNPGDFFFVNIRGVYYIPVKHKPRLTDNCCNSPRSAQERLLISWNTKMCRTRVKV